MVKTKGMRGMERRKQTSVGLVKGWCFTGVFSVEQNHEQVVSFNQTPVKVILRQKSIKATTQTDK